MRRTSPDRGESQSSEREYITSPRSKEDLHVPSQHYTTCRPTRHTRCRSDQHSALFIDHQSRFYIVQTTVQHVKAGSKTVLLYALGLSNSNSKNLQITYYMYYKYIVVIVHVHVHALAPHTCMLRAVFIYFLNYGSMRCILQYSTVLSVVLPSTTSVLVPDSRPRCPSPDSDSLATSACCHGKYGVPISTLQY